MIQLILELLRKELSDYIRQGGGLVGDEPPVVLGNIGLSNIIGGSENYMQNRVVLSLVNLMEEATLKNRSPYKISNNKTEKVTPPIYLNLFLLFTANFGNAQNGTDNGPYINGLTNLSLITEFFQSRQVFSIKNAPTGANIQNVLLQNIKISMELYSMTFEQINHLWGTLGGKQLPFVMYLARVLPVQRTRVLERGSKIQDVQTDITQVL